MNWERIAEIEAEARKISSFDKLKDFVIDLFDDKDFKQYMQLQARMSGKKSRLYNITFDILISENIKTQAKWQMNRTQV